MHYLKKGLQEFYHMSSWSNYILLLLCFLILLLIFLRVRPILKLKKQGKIPNVPKPSEDTCRSALRIRKCGLCIILLPLVFLPFIIFLAPALVYTSDYLREAGLFSFFMTLALIISVVCFCIFASPFLLQKTGCLLLGLMMRCPACKEKLPVDHEFVEGYLYIRRDYGAIHAKKYESHRLRCGGLPSIPTRCPHCHAKLIDSFAEEKRIQHYKIIRQSSPWYFILR